jgi:hypothetical protein
MQVRKPLGYQTACLVGPWPSYISVPGAPGEGQLRASSPKTLMASILCTAFMSHGYCNRRSNPARSKIAFQPRGKAVWRGRALVQALRRSEDSAHCTPRAAGPRRAPPFLSAKRWHTGCIRHRRCKAILTIIA